jgi:hypothetical protein
MNINQALTIIKSYYPLKDNGQRYQELLVEAIEIIREKTHGFTNENGLSTEKMDVSHLLRQNEISVSEWFKVMGDMALSEQDAAIEIANWLDKPKSQTADKQRKLKLAKAKAKALLLILQLNE